MKKIKMIKYDEAYIYMTEDTMEIKAGGLQLRAMISAFVNCLVNKGTLTKEEITHAVELGLSTDDELEERVTEAISNILDGVSKAMKEEKQPKKKAQPKKTTKKEGNK